MTTADPIMGNVGFKRSQSSASRPPSDLSTLLSLSLDENRASEQEWLRLFRAYIEKKSLEHLIVALDFALTATDLKNDHSDQHKMDLLHQMRRDFFDSTKGPSLVLSNQILLEELISHLSALSSSSSSLRESCELVQSALSDSKVWRAGLERQYTLFLATRPQLPSLAAVIMSIL